MKYSIWVQLSGRIESAERAVRIDGAGEAERCKFEIEFDAVSVL